MSKKKQQRYTPEFRVEAVKLVAEQGLSQEVVATRLAISTGTLANWVAAAKRATPGAAPGARTTAELESEITRLRKELAEAPDGARHPKKRATAYFARESLPGTRS